MKSFKTLALGLMALSGAACASLSAAGSTYYLNDNLATTVGTADASGEIAALEADAFGSPVAAGHAPSRYTGKPYDSDMGAYVFPFRNYRSQEGRWMSADPSGFPDGLNNFAYVNGNVFSNIDPFGLATIPVNWTYDVPGTTHDLHIIMSFDLVVNESQLTPTITSKAWTGVWGDGSITSQVHNGKTYTLSTGSIIISNSGDEVRDDGFHHNWITVSAYVNVTISEGGTSSPTSYASHTTGRYYGTAKGTE